MIIGISGKARVGKDTFGDFLMEQFVGWEMHKVAYADELKRKIMDDFDLSWEQVYGDLKEEEDHRYPKPLKEGMVPQFWTPREIMQFLGTDCYRAIDDNFWVKQLFKRLFESGIKNVIISDCRFVSEIDAVLERGGIHVRIYRDSEEYTLVHNTQHISETALDNYEKIDFEINNNGTLKGLKEKAIYLAKFIKEK